MAVVKHYSEDPEMRSFAGRQSNKKSLQIVKHYRPAVVNDCGFKRRIVFSMEGSFWL